MSKAARYIDNYKTDDEGIRWVRLDHVNEEIEAKDFIINDLTKRLAVTMRKAARSN